MQIPILAAHLWHAVYCGLLSADIKAVLREWCGELIFEAGRRDPPEMIDAIDNDGHRTQALNHQRQYAIPQKERPQVQSLRDPDKEVVTHRP